ncbi:helix-turn-helix domain-containing protein [Rhizobium sp. TH2]|uniref:helix-turn-helix domain-containing protein n=1 Tax=Rhizobium sp. TH2 TaxID=2775403 RepID=UPI00280C1986|nr:helix-turn-helix domain-containing protein [Rhizobium sp. TH2]
MHASKSVAMKMLCTPVQVRAARVLLGWSQQKLADEADVSRSTLALVERGDNLANNASRERIQRALEKAGLEFLPPDATKGSGIRYANHQTERDVG